MIHLRLNKIVLALACVLMVASCGSVRNPFAGGSAGSASGDSDKSIGADNSHQGLSDRRRVGSQGRSLLDAFRGGKSNVKVNRFLWTASLDVLNFLPVQTADPFTGVISTGYGRPPGGGQAYRATVLISDPALDARSLKVALQTQRGPVSNATQRAVEDAILTRARQLRIDAGRF